MPSTPHVVERQMVFTCTATWIFDNNEPKCVLSPRLLRVPNSSYKILGYIPDISGHGNHGVIYNSAYKLNSGANGYLVDFTTFRDYGNKGIVRTDSKIYLDESFDYDKGFWLGYTNSPSPTYKVRVSGIPKDGVLSYTGGSWINLINGINDFLARGGRGRSGRGGRGRGMMNRIGYRTYNNYEGDEHRSYDEHHRGYDDDERMLLMRMLGVGEDERYEYGDEHFNKQEAKQTVDEMYHVKDGKKYIGEKYDMQKAHEVCNKFKDKLEEDIEVADVYVAINAQYHDYCKLFEKWFGKGNFDDMIFESAIDFWFDDVDFGEDKLWKYFNELK